MNLNDIYNNPIIYDATLGKIYSTITNKNELSSSKSTLAKVLGIQGGFFANLFGPSKDTQITREIKALLTIGKQQSWNENNIDKVTAIAKFFNLQPEEFLPTDISDPLVLQDVANKSNDVFQGYVNSNNRSTTQNNDLPKKLPVPNVQPINNAEIRARPPESSEASSGWFYTIAKCCAVAVVLYLARESTVLSSQTGLVHSNPQDTTTSESHSPFSGENNNSLAFLNNHTFSTLNLSESLQELSEFDTITEAPLLPPSEHIEDPAPPETTAPASDTESTQWSENPPIESSVAAFETMKATEGQAGFTFHPGYTKYLDAYPQSRGPFNNKFDYEDVIQEPELSKEEFNKKWRQNHPKAFDEAGNIRERFSDWYIDEEIPALIEQEFINYTIERRAEQIGNINDYIQFDLAKKKVKVDAMLPNSSLLYERIKFSVSDGKLLVFLIRDPDYDRGNLTPFGRRLAGIIDLEEYNQAQIENAIHNAEIDQYSVTLNLF